MNRKRVWASAVTLGVIGVLSLFGAQPARAGITLLATAGPTGIENVIPGVNGLTAMPGVDPASLFPAAMRITLTTGLFNTPVGGNQIAGQVDGTQSYSPLFGPPGSITAALATSTTAQLTNVSGATVTVILTLTYDSFNYPVSDPLNWRSTISASRLEGGATYTSTETVGATVINHMTLTNANILNNTASQTITAVTSPGRPFSVVQKLTIVLPSMATADFTKSDTLDAVPEPASVALALTGAPLLGLLWLRRRAKA